MAAITDLVGRWQGKNRLWVRPDEPVSESKTTASISPLLAGGRFATIRYDWGDEGVAQDGLLLVPLADEQNSIDLFWVDSWHMGNKFMLLRREEAHDVIVTAKGTYAAPSGPDWGWRITIRAESTNEMWILMHNIPPQSEELLAVEASYSRIV